MPGPADLLQQLQVLAQTIAPGWCHSGPDPNNDYLPRTMNTGFGDVAVANDFADWVLTGTAIPPGGHMNCWEAIMYAAYLARLVSRERLEVLHRGAALRARLTVGNAAAKSTAYNDALMELFGYGNFVMRGGHVNVAGDIVFIEDAAQPVMERYKHVMVGSGGPECGWSHDISQAQASGGFGVQANLVQVTEFRHIHLGGGGHYAARCVAFPF